MADKSFGVKELNLISASGTPTITSPNSVNINATNVAISTDITVGGMVSLGAGTSISSPGSNVLTFGTNSTEKVRIDSSGNVNIGSNLSSNPFTYLRFGASQYGAADIRPTDDGSHKVGLVFYTDGTQDTTINPTEALRIAANGDIGIANASPTNWGAGVPTIEIKGTVSSGGNSTRSGAIAFESGSGNNGYSVLWGWNGGIHIYTGATDRASATYAAQFNSSGNLAFASGNGIDFSANSNASGMTSELLDDYEEGTWTPTITGLGNHNNNASGTWGKYTKIGNRVFITWRYSWTSRTTTNGGVVYLESLPFGSANDSKADAVYIGGLEGIRSNTGREVYGGNVLTNSSIIQFRASGDNVSENSLFGSLSTSMSSGYIYGGANYIVP